MPYISLYQKLVSCTLLFTPILIIDGPNRDGFYPRLPVSHQILKYSKEQYQINTSILCRCFCLYRPKMVLGVVELQTSDLLIRESDAWWPWIWPCDPFATPKRTWLTLAAGWAWVTMSVEARELLMVQGHANCALRQNTLSLLQQPTRQIGPLFLSPAPSIT